MIRLWSILPGLANWNELQTQRHLSKHVNRTNLSCHTSNWPCGHVTFAFPCAKSDQMGCQEQKKSCWKIALFVRLFVWLWSCCLIWIDGIFSNGTRNWREWRRSGRTNAPMWITRVIRRGGIQSYFTTPMHTGRHVSYQSSMRGKTFFDGLW